MWTALRTDCQRYGVRRTFISRFAWQLERRGGIQVYRIGCRPLSAIHQEPRACPPDLDLKLLNPQEILDASTDAGLELPRDVAQESIARGDIVVGGFKQSQLIAYVFASTDTAPHDDSFFVKVRKPFRYSFKNFTRTEYRGQGISYFLNNFPERNEACRQRGCTDSVFFIALSNLPSLKANSKLMGTAWIGWTLNGQTFGYSWSLRSAGPRRVGFQFVRRADR